MGHTDDPLQERVAASVEDLIPRLERMEAMLRTLVEQRTAKDWYTTAEVGKAVVKSDYTVREWCRQGRVAAKKRACGRGTASEWVISHQELERIRNEGLLPLRTDA